ncbi:MAG: phytanoyl-CoA dioxygenase family protein [Armatimonadota bacterium]|nr:phytanoyl-CoA dioxygenase family protein [Armatimonadota bacterium]MDW8103738.1 phytanoyl-CoA dioxygenase family protein [Armatimonadota bacterium]
MLTQEQIEQYHRDGYTVARSLFSREEAEFYIEHYMRLREAGTYPGDFQGVDPSSNDPLKRYPRMIHMHRWDEVSLRWMIDPRLNACMTRLLGKEPYAVQTMLYFKPPGARGQALHQDNFYLRVQPGTCIAAWMALDPCDEENGCLMVVPGTQDLPILCTIPADTTQSFTDITVPVPKDMPIVPVVMEPGDVLFFNGSLIHGSNPNRSTHRFRRALIGHYAVGDAQKIAQFYHPVLRMDGTVVELGISEGGGPCGVWVERDGKRVVEMVQPTQQGKAPEHE